jgi:hypothetical protein
VSDLNASLSHLRLSFEAIRETSPFDSDQTAYEVKLTNSAGQHFMLMRLPVQLVESVVLADIQPTITMTPDGMLSVQFEHGEDDADSQASMAIDDLIEQCLAPAMLEDESDVWQMLQSLRAKLERALDIVDGALADIQ